MQENFGIGPEQVETLFDYAKCIYECGDYEAAGELLHQYCTYSVDPPKLLAAMWGKLASEILAFNVRPACHLPPLTLALSTHCPRTVHAAMLHRHHCTDAPRRRIHHRNAEPRATPEQRPRF